MSRPIVLVHGYSDKSDSFKKWEETLNQHFSKTRGFQVCYCNYKTLTNEISLKDLSEGFERALRASSHIKNDQEFDVIVHSTGMLVLRAWLMIDNPEEAKKRQKRLKHLIALAPATFGSPLAHKGRSWMGALFKGNKEEFLGPDFMESGDLILDALELASPYTWDLAHKDMLALSANAPPVFGRNEDTPYAFIFCGTGTYGIFANLLTNSDGSDGTVRWAGCALTTRKIMIDLSRNIGDSNPQDDAKHFSLTPWTNEINMPFTPIKGLNHGSIIQNPTQELQNMVLSALSVKDHSDYDKWLLDIKQRTEDVYNGIVKWQQFIVKLIDERGDPIPDYYVQLFADNPDKKFHEFSMDVYSYSQDTSYRCFHVNLDKLKDDLGLPSVEALSTIDYMCMRIMSVTGTDFVGYIGYGAEKLTGREIRSNPFGAWDAKIRIPDKIFDDKGVPVSLFFPFTTTLLEIRLNREPIPFQQDQPIKLVSIQASNQNIGIA